LFDYPGETPLVVLYDALPWKIKRKGPRPNTPDFERWLRLGELVHHLERWRWFFTLTSGDGVTPKQLQRWANHIAAEYGDHVPVAFGVEGAGEERHVHGLAAFTSEEKPPVCREGESLWESGNARVKLFCSTLGGAWYVTKELNWGLTYGCPRKPACRRASGCRNTGERIPPPYWT
jgi:hypothetical protein